MVRIPFQFDGATISVFYQYAAARTTGMARGRIPVGFAGNNFFRLNQKWDCLIHRCFGTSRHKSRKRKTRRF